MRARFVTGVLVAAGVLSAAWQVNAQTYPAKPVRIIIPFTAGGVVELTATAVGETLAGMWGQPVRVESRPGGGGTTGTAEAAKAPADGYTLLVSSSAFAVNAVLHAHLPYDAQKSFVAISALASSPNILAVSKSSGYRSVAELIAAAKRSPGQLKYGSVGIGSGTHFAAVKFVQAAGIQAAHVPQDKGASVVDEDLKAGRIAFWMAPMWAPAGTPAPVIARLRKDVPAAVDSYLVRERFAKHGVAPLNVSGEDFAKLVRNEIADTARIAKAAGLAPQH